MQQNLVRMARGHSAMTLAPVVADRVGEDRARFIECRRGDAAAHIRITLETVLGVFVPEVKRPIATRCAKGTMLWVEGEISSYQKFRSYAYLIQIYESPIFSE